MRNLLLIFPLVLSFSIYAKSSKNDRPTSDSPETNHAPIAEMSFMDYKSEIWDYNGQSQLAALEVFPQEFYHHEGFEISPDAHNLSISSLVYKNIFIRRPDMPLLGFAPLFDRKKLVGVHLDPSYLSWELNNAKKEQYILRPKGRHTFYVQFSDGTTNLDNYFMYEEHRNPRLARAAEIIRTNFGFSPVLRRHQNSTYIIGGAEVDESQMSGSYSRSSGFGLSIGGDGFKIGAWNTSTGNLKPLKIQAFQIPPGHSVSNIGRYSQMLERDHSQAAIIQNFLFDLSFVQEQMYRNTYENNLAKFQAKPLAQIDLIEYISDDKEELDASQLDFENQVQQKNEAHLKGIYSILALDDDEIQAAFQTKCHQLSKHLKLSKAIAPKCIVMASERRATHLLGANYLIMTVGKLKSFETEQDLNRELAQMFAHLELRHSIQKIPFHKNIESQGMSLAVAGNYFSYLNLIEGHQRNFIASWFPQLARHKEDLADLGQTLIEQNLMIAAGNFSDQQKYSAKLYAEEKLNDFSEQLSPENFNHFDRLK